MADLSCCFTGHRFIRSDLAAPLYSLLSDRLRALYTVGYTEFYAGGALGFDTLAAQAVLQQKQSCAKMRLHLILPCQDQHLRWNARQRECYLHILEQADSYQYIAEEYLPGVMQQRNRMLVRHSQLCLCYLNPSQTRGGTVFTVRYAEESGRLIQNLFEETAIAGGLQTAAIDL